MTRRLMQVGGACVACLLISGCVSATSTPSAPQPKIRQSVVTAPADLQLLCSAATANKFNVRQDEILPVGSDAVSPNVFRVDVQSKGATYRCVVNRQAVILELARL